MKTKWNREAIKAGTARVLSGARIGRPRRVAWVLTAGLLAWAATVSAGPGGGGGKRSFDTMAINLYIGTGIERVLDLDPTSPDYVSDLVFTVTGVYYELVASQPPVRMQGVADAIAARMPEIVAVNEATLLRNQSPGDLVVQGTTPATNVVFDYLELLVNALESRGAHYTVAATTDEWDVEAPMMNLETGTLDDVRQTDRDAILVRTDLPRGQLAVSNPQSGHFTNVFQFPAIGLVLNRGWCSVDVFVRGQNFRYVCTHPDDESFAQFQFLQVMELVGLLANANLPLIVAGDLNADPFHRNGTQTYGLFVTAGFGDAWAATHPDDLEGGLTWGHDEFLADPTTAFVSQIDHVLYRGAGFVPSYADVVDVALDRTQPPLWASDHAAVVAGFMIERAPFARAGANPLR